MPFSRCGTILLLLLAMLAWAGNEPEPSEFVIPDFAEIACFGALQNDSEISELMQRLQAGESSNEAAQRLMKLAKSDLEVRYYLTRQLPPLISKGPQDPPLPWLNAVRLSGDLKIVEAAPALANWAGLDWGGVTGMSRYARLEDNPPCQALAKIGDPAVPTLRNVLQRGTLQQRTNAVRTLNLIGSSESKNALADHLKAEPDGHLKQMIEGILAK